MTSPADALAEAMKQPPGAEAARDLYSKAAGAVLGGTPPASRSAEALLAQMPDFPFEYHCKRFVMGYHTEKDDEGNKIATPMDDEEELSRIMQLQWDKKGFIYKRLETFLQDGTVVIWVEWGEPKAAAPVERPAHARTVGELLDPRVPPASAGAIPPESKEKPSVTGDGGTAEDVFAAPGTELEGELGESNEDEPDWR